MLPVYRQILATAADLRNPENPERVIDELLEKGHKLIESAEDTVNQNRLEWWLGIALAEGVRLQRLRGDAVSALEIADEAVTLLQQSARQRQSTPEQRYLVGRLYFHIGSIHAVQRKDHEEAIVWYKKAEPLLMDELPLATLADPGTHGEMFVSIAVSYWETGNHQKAIDLTEFGTDVLQRAVVEGVLMPDVLTIPYGNLAAMHKKAGHDEDAKAFAELASSIKTETKKR
jgi:tetratricopeptide (TPR) repeat protein